MLFRSSGARRARINDDAGKCINANQPVNIEVNNDRIQFEDSVGRHLFPTIQISDDTREILYTEDGKYAANVEKAISLPVDAEVSPFDTYEKLETPGTETIEKMCEFLHCSATNIVKNVLYQASYDNGITVLVLVSIRGDQDVNDVKLLNELTKYAGNYEAKAVLALTVPDVEAQKKWAAKSLPLGYIAPDLSEDYITSSKQVSPKFLRMVDQTAYT